MVGVLSHHNPAHTLSTPDIVQEPLIIHQLLLLTIIGTICPFLLLVSRYPHCYSLHPCGYTTLGPHARFISRVSRDLSPFFGITYYYQISLPTHCLNHCSWFDPLSNHHIITICSPGPYYLGVPQISVPLRPTPSIRFFLRLTFVDRIRIPRNINIKSYQVETPLLLSQYGFYMVLQLIIPSTSKEVSQGILPTEESSVLSSAFTIIPWSLFSWLPERNNSVLVGISGMNIKILEKSRPTPFHHFHLMSIGENGPDF